MVAAQFILGFLKYIYIYILRIDTFQIKYFKSEGVTSVTLFTILNIVALYTLLDFEK